MKDRNKALDRYAKDRNAVCRMSELKLIIHDLRHPKSLKQAALTELREIEKSLGIAGEPYNGDS